MRKQICIVFLLSILFAVTVCSSAETADTITPKEGITIGIAVPALNQPFWRTYIQHTTDACEKLGIEYIVTNAEESDSEQLNQVMGLISSKVDGIILVPNTSIVAESMLEQAEEAGIPVYFSSRYPSISKEEWKGDCYIGFIGNDNVIRGYAIAEGLYNAGARKFVAIGGTSGASNSDDRSKGLHKFIEEHSDVELLQELRNAEVREIGMNYTENFLSSFPGPAFDGIWCYNDDTAMGAIEALTAVGANGKVAVAGVDLLPEALEAIKNGNMVYSNAPSTYNIPYATVIQLYDAIHGIMPDEGYTFLTAGFNEVTAENVTEYEEKYVLNSPNIDPKQYSRVFNPSATTKSLLEM